MPSSNDSDTAPFAEFLTNSTAKFDTAFLTTSFPALPLMNFDRLASGKLMYSIAVVANAP